MNRKNSLFLVILLLLLLVLTVACGGGEEDIQPTPDSVGDTEPTPEPPPATEPADVTADVEVESVEVLLLESFPVQVNVIASGTLPNGCYTLNEPAPRQEGNTFIVNLSGNRLENEICTQALVPFDQVIPLNVTGLSAGTYTVAVNGVTQTFTLETDNIAQEEPDPTPTPQGADTGAISGTVWHDLCAVAGGELGEPLVPSDGCVALEDGTYQANAIRETDEPGIGGILVSLGEGACPASLLTTTVTDDSGAYDFTALEPGVYCVSVDALEEDNSDILIPGTWTAPEVEEEGAPATLEVTVTAGEVAEEIDFGWDYEGLPEPGDVATVDEGDEGDTTGESCIDSAEFVADVTIQDNEIIPPNLPLTKTWRLLNNGTCTWTTNYDLVFVGGDRLGAQAEKPLSEPVEPNEATNVSVNMVSPNINGVYRGDWMLRNEQGELFGIPEVRTFWYQFEVTAAIPASGSAITGLVFSDPCEVSGDQVPEGCVEDGEGGYRADGIFEGGEERLQGVTVSVAEGECPATEVLETTTTGTDGRFLFTGLDSGTYCVFVNREAGRNATVLGSGVWTFPEFNTETPFQEIILGVNDTIYEVNFGWDFQDN